MVGRTEDLLRKARPSWQIADPLLRFYSATLRPNWALVERGDAARLADRIIEPWRGQVLGPHLENLTRQWVATHADQTTLGGVPERVGRAVVNDRASRTTHELEVVVTEGDRVAAIGEVKLRRMDADDADRLRVLRTLLPGAATARILLVSAAGFTPAVAGPDLELVDLRRLYEGS